MLDLQKACALCIRKFLTKILTPATAFLQQQNLPSSDRSSPLRRKTITYIIRWLSWFFHGLITFSYPCMRYNPIKLRRWEIASEWASEILNIPPQKLKEVATAFLREQQSKQLDSSPPNSSHDSVISQKISFSILLCFHHHLAYFKDCLNSIQEALSHSPESQVEVILIHDDPLIDLSQSLKELDPCFREKVRFYIHSKNQGICNSLNEAISYAQGEWLLYLDCDDLLDPTTFLVLEKKIREHPHICFISSRAADIDMDGDVLFWRLRSEQSYQLIKNNFADHLKVIKKSLHQDLGLLKKSFEGCQDYEFALRAAINEPILFIPNYLYRYRWHQNTQTISQNRRQNLTAMRVRQTYMLAIYWLIYGTEMIEWNITGPEANSWEQHLTSITNKNSQNHTRSQVTLEATTPYTPLRWKLLLVELATIIMDRYREAPTQKTELYKRKIYLMTAS